MAVGDLITANMQYEFRGWLFGSGTSYVVETVDGILGLPSARTNDLEKQEDHGDHAGVDLIPGRTITMTMSALGDSVSTQGLMDLVLQKMQTSKRAAFVEYPFVTQRPGHGKRFVNARPRRAEFPSNYETAHGRGIGALQWYATDPRWYSLAQSVQAVNLANTALAGNATANMTGDFEDGVEPIIEIQGPVTNPRIQNAADGNKTIRIDVVVNAGQTLYIDTRLKTVFLAGVDRYDTVRADNEWFSLLPGANVITLNRSNAGASMTMFLRWYNGWASA